MFKEARKGENNKLIFMVLKMLNLGTEDVLQW
jgi:hypothetical protein